MVAHSRFSQATEGPQPLLRQTPPGLPYPVAALGPLRRGVEAVQGMTLAPMALPAQSALTVASLAVQGFADVETLAGQSPLSLYALTIASSGERKTTCDTLLMKALRVYEKEQTAAHRDEVGLWHNQHALWKGERERILVETRKAKGESRVAAEADLRALGQEPAAPSSPDRTVTEPTYEGLVRKFAEGHPSLGIFSDEGGQFLGGYAMNSDNRQKTLAALNDLWQGNPIRRTRAGEGSLSLFGRRLAVHLMVQPSVARAFMADPQTSDTGFLPRFLITEPPSTIGTRLQTHIRHDDEGLEAFERRLTEVLATPLPMDPESRELTPRLLWLTADSQKLLAAFADKVELQQGKGADLQHVTGFASKAAEQAARIAGVLCLWDDLNANNVRSSIMAQAITLAEYFLGEAKRLAHVASISVETERAESLRIWLQENWTDSVILPNDVVQRAPIRSLRERKAARAAIKVLVEHGWLVPLKQSTVVRGSVRREAYQVVRLGDEAQ